jgi:hypothetical protein
MSNDNGQKGFVLFGVTLIALVLAFFVGRLTAHGGEGPKGGSSLGPERPDSTEAVQRVEAALAEGAKDGAWSDDEDDKFRRALAPLSHAGQLKELSVFVLAVNSGKLRIVSPEAPAPTPSCCNLCNSPVTPRPADQGAAAKKSAPAAK